MKTAIMENQVEKNMDMTWTLALHTVGGESKGR